MILFSGVGACSYTWGRKAITRNSGTTYEKEPLSYNLQNNQDSDTPRNYAIIVTLQKEENTSLVQ